MAYLDIADKATLDIIKNNTDIIKSQSSDYIDSHFLGLNFKLLKTSEYLIVSDLITYVGATKTILDVTGKGYIESLYVNNTNSRGTIDMPSNFIVIIRTDGVERKFVAYTSSDYKLEPQRPVGFSSFTDKPYAPYKNIDSTNIYDILSTNNIIRNNGFKFNKSLKVEIQRKGDISSYIEMRYLGGVIIG